MYLEIAIILIWQQTAIVSRFLLLLVKVFANSAMGYILVELHLAISYHRLDFPIWASLTLFTQTISNLLILVGLIQKSSPRVIKIFSS